MTYAYKACQTIEGLYHMCYRFQFFNRKYYGINAVICYDTCPCLVPNSNVQCHLMTFLDRLSLYHFCNHSNYVYQLFKTQVPHLVSLQRLLLHHVDTMILHQYLFYLMDFHQVD